MPAVKQGRIRGLKVTDHKTDRDKVTVTAHLQALYTGSGMQGTVDAEFDYDRDALRLLTYAEIEDLAEQAAGVKLTRWHGKANTVTVDRNI